MGLRVVFVLDWSHSDQATLLSNLDQGALMMVARDEVRLIRQAI